MALNSDGGSDIVMPVQPMAGNGGGWGFGNDSWIILFLFAMMFGGGWGNGWNGNGFGNMYEFPWLLNGQNGINNNVNDGFRSAQVSDAIMGVQNGINGIATQLCNGFAGNVAAVNNAQAALAQQMYTDQITDLERSFAAQTAVTQGMNAIQGQLAQCCCDNRLATANLQSVIQTENCADRQAISDGIRDLLTATTAQNQRILDQLCQDKIDAKNDTIAQLRQELIFARGQASQDVQTARILAGQTSEVDALYNRLSNCPVPSTPVYGRQPIFTCGGGCGCGAA